MNTLLASVCISSFLSSFMGSSINIAVPFLAHDYQVAPEDITWVFNVFLITSASALLPATALANRKGFVRTYQIGTISAALTTLLVPFAPTFALLIFLRGLQGLAFAVFFCSGMAVLVDKTPREKRASAIAANVSAVYAGLSLSPIAAGAIADLAGWEGIFYAAGIGQCISFFLALKLSPDTGQSPLFPFLKMLLCFSGGSLFLLGLSILDHGNIGWVLTAVSLVLLFSYLTIEVHSKHPILPVFMVLKNKLLSLSLTSAMLNFIATFAMGMLLSMHLQIILGKSAIFTGLVLMALPIIMLIASSMTARLTVLLGAHSLTVLGLILMTCGVAGLIFLEPKTSLTYILACQMTIGLGNGLFSAPNANIIMSSVERTEYALASSLQSIVRTSGMAISMAIVTLLLNANIDAQPGTTLYVWELSASISMAFKVSALVCAAAAGCEIIEYLASRKKLKNKEES